jgi:hypothetical protein
MDVLGDMRKILDKAALMEFTLIYSYTTAGT